MGTRGPAPTPTNILKNRGSWRAAIRGDEVEYPRGAPPCPKSLSADAKREWKRVAKLLKNANVLQVADLAVLASYVRTWAEWMKLTELSAGWDYADEGDRKQARLLADTEKRLARLAAEFGFTPSSRTRIMPGRSETDPFAGRVPVRRPTALDLAGPPTIT